MPVRRTPRSRRTGRRLAADAGLLVVAATFALPLAWVVLSALDPHAGLRVQVPDGLTLDNFDAVLKPDITYTPLLNSLILCGAGRCSRWCARRWPRIRCRGSARD